MKTVCGLEEQLALWDGVLQLDGFEVVNQAEDVAEKTLRFTVIPKMGAAVCPHGGGCGGRPIRRGIATASAICRSGSGRLCCGCA